MKIYLASLAQRLFNVMGLHVSRRARGVQIDSALEEQLRLAGPDLRTIIEIGAADGRDAAIYADRCPKAHVHAFEPLPANFEKLAQRVAANPRIRPVNKAVSDKNGKAEFHVTALDDSSSLLQPTKTSTTFDKYLEQVDKISISTVTLDSYCVEQQINHIDLLKMDAQGAELMILQGASNLLDTNSISVIFSEVNFIQMYKGIALYHELASYLSTKKYVLHCIYNLVYDHHGRLAWGDAIFCQASKAGSTMAKAVSG